MIDLDEIEREAREVQKRVLCDPDFGGRIENLDLTLAMTAELRRLRKVRDEATTFFQNNFDENWPRCHGVIVAITESWHQDGGWTIKEFVEKALKQAGEG